MARKNRNGEGSVFPKRKNGVEIGWVAQVTVGHKEDGSPIYTQVVCKSEPEAQAKKYEITGESVGTDLALNALKHVQITD